MSVGMLGMSTTRSWVIRQLQAIPAGRSILDVGAGQGPFQEYCKHLSYKSQDFCQYDGTGNGVALQNDTWEYRAIDYVSDITNIPVPSGSFDAVLCTEVLEHVSNPIAALEEISRVLGGAGSVAILTAPFCCLTHQAPHFYQTGFSEYFYKSHLGRLGFDVEIERNGNFFEWMAQEVRRIPGAAETYTNARLGKDSENVLLHVLALLRELSKRDKGSSELLCYGLHVRAVRR